MEENLLATIEELKIELEKVKKENEKLKRRKNKRPQIKTTKKQIVDYWDEIEDEGELGVDFSDAEEICWRCGCKRNLERCHIIPEALGGKDEPSNLVLLCKRCHIDAPNVESKTFMWDWIKANKTTFYNTFWDLRAQKEYEFIYNKSFIEELKDRDILSHRDLSIFYSLPIGRSVNHFAHPWKNDSTNAGLLRMRLEEYDKGYPNKKAKSKLFREKEEKFNNVVRIICNIAKEYNWNVWEGRSQNSFSITINTFISIEKQKAISIKLGRNNKYKVCFTKEINPNNNKASDYTIEIGEDYKKVEDFIRKEVEKFDKENGRKEKQEYVFTINPIYRLSEK